MTRQVIGAHPTSKQDERRFWQGKGLYLVLFLVSVLLLVVGGRWLFANQQEPVVHTIYTPTKAASQNRYFAAQQFLGDKATVLKGRSGRDELSLLFQETNAKQTAIIMYDVSANQQELIESMLTWVQQGGHLIIANQSGQAKDARNNKQNPLLLKLGITYQYDDFTDFDHTEGFSYALVPLRLPTGQTMVVQGDFGRFDASAFYRQYPKARLLDYRWFERHQGKHHPKQPLIANLSADELAKLRTAIDKDDKMFDPHSALLDIEFGQGRLSILSTPKMFANPINYPQIVNDTRRSTHGHTWQLLTNTAPASLHNYRGNIAAANNVMLLEYLTQERQTVYLVPDIESIGFFTLLWRHLMWSVVGLGMTLVLVLLALPKRFGASKSYQTDTSHNIFGFFAHVGRYLWASDKANALLKGNRQTLIHSIIAKEQIHEPNANKLIVTVAQKTGLSAGLIHDALYQEWQSQAEFLRICRSFAQVARHYALA